MGLASKLAAAQAGGYGAAPPGGYSQQQAPLQQQAPPQPLRPGGSNPGQQQYQAYPGSAQPGQQPPPSQQYPPQGGYPLQGQPYGGRPPSGPPAHAGAFKQLLIQQIREKQLEVFYPPNASILDHLAQKAAAQIGGLCQRWRIPPEIGNDLCRLALYDVIIYIDDSGSMQFEEGGERISDLRTILTRVASVSTIFDEDGVQLRFMNSNYDVNMLDNIRSEQQIDQLMRTVSFKGLTPMGTALRQKVIDGIIISKLRSGRYTKPTLVITITDGQPAGEKQTATHDAVQYAVEEVSRRYGRGGVAFQFAQVGNDAMAREFLAKLDTDPVVGGMVDCTSNYENESEEMKNQGVDLTPELWLVKLMLGAIDSSYDRKDEKQEGAPPPVGHGGPPGGYGGPQGGYGGPQGGYGGTSGGGYGGAPQGGYGGVPTPPGGQYGRPPQGYPPQGGYQQQGPSGYGAAPPPPRY